MTMSVRQAVYPKQTVHYIYANRAFGHTTELGVGPGLGPLIW